MSRHVSRVPPSGGKGARLTALEEAEDSGMPETRRLDETTSRTCPSPPAILQVNTIPARSHAPPKITNSSKKLAIIIITTATKDKNARSAWGELTEIYRELSSPRAHGDCHHGRHSHRTEKRVRENLVQRHLSVFVGCSDRWPKMSTSEWMKQFPRRQPEGKRWWGARSLITLPSRGCYGGERQGSGWQSSQSRMAAARHVFAWRQAGCTDGLRDGHAGEIHCCLVIFMALREEIKIRVVVVLWSSFLSNDLNMLKTEWMNRGV